MNFNNIERFDDPWPHWEIHDIFDGDMLDFLYTINLSDCNSNIVGDYNRDALRFTKYNAKRYPLITDIVRKFLDRNVIETISKLGESIGSPVLDDTYVRIDLACDREGYTLKPHLDREAKVFTMQVYLPDGEQDAGTEFQNEELETVKKLQFRKNSGYFFFPRSKFNKIQWHGLMAPYVGDRRTLLINYMLQDDSKPQGDPEPGGYRKFLSRSANQHESWWTVK